MARKYLVPVFFSIVGPFTLNPTTKNWDNTTGTLGICDEVANYFDIPDGVTSFRLQATATKPDHPHLAITLKQGPTTQGCLSYNCPERSADKWFKVQEPLRPLANRLWEGRPAGATTLVIYVSLFTD